VQSRRLRREHLLDRFDCGKEVSNRFLMRQAWNNQQAHSAQTDVLAKDLRILGYYMGHALDLGKCAFAVAFEREWALSAATAESLRPLSFRSIRSTQFATPAFRTDTLISIEK
jgi:hypothetical protein